MGWQPTVYLPPADKARQHYEMHRSREIRTAIAASIVFAGEGCAGLAIGANKIGYTIGLLSVASQLRAVWVAETWQPPQPEA